MSNKKRYFKHSRSFLSSHYDEGSTISWDVTVENDNVYANVSLRDCYKRVDLSFWMDDGDRSIDTRLLKISILIDELTLFRESLKQGHAIYSLFKPLRYLNESKKGEVKDE